MYSEHAVLETWADLKRVDTRDVGVIGNIALQSAIHSSIARNREGLYKVHTIYRFARAEYPLPPQFVRRTEKWLRRM